MHIKEFYKFVTIGSAFRIMSGGLAEQSNVIDLGDIILEVNNIPIHSAEDLSALVRRLSVIGHW
jgi:S1-C subfamily serine protease